MFQFLICSPALGAATLEGRRLEQIADGIEELGYQLITCRTIENASLAVRTDAAIGCILLEWGDGAHTGEAGAFVDFLRGRGL